MALAFCRSRSFVATTIIGATMLEQLRENLALPELPPEVLQGIAEIHARFNIPAP